MTSLPMYRPNPVADAAHRVTAPGGYEWWYFDAEDVANDRQLVAIYLNGFVFHPGYLRAWKRWRRRPTRHPPPRPGEFACAYFVLYERGRIATQFITQIAPDALRFDEARVNIAMGPNTLKKQNHAEAEASDSSTHSDETRKGATTENDSETSSSLSLHLEGAPWNLTMQGPKTHRNRKLVTDLTFSPRLPHRPVERTFLSRKMTGAEHHWVIADPLCDVAGRIETGVPGVPPIDFAGVGYHDHNYGTGPLGPGLKRWFWGRAIFADRVVTFHFAQANDATLADEVHVVEASAAGVVDHAAPPIHPAGAFNKCSWLGLRYPDAMTFGDALTISNPRVVDHAPFYMRLQFDALSRGERSTAFCEIAYPRRLLYPILGRMIEMSIDRG